MENIKVLDQIILSQEVTEDFHKEYDENNEFKSWLDELIPEIEKCKNQQQNNPWHKYNVLDHILHSVEEMNKQTIGMPKEERRLLAYTMLLHDIGKPKCHIERIKNGQKIDSFFNHNIESEVVAKRALPKLGFNEEEIKIISKLVFKHDIFMFIKDKKTNNPYWKVLSPALVEDEINDLSSVGDGEKLMCWLVMVGRSDNLAQNEKMTGDSLRLLDKIDKMLYGLLTEKNR